MGHDADHSSFLDDRGMAYAVSRHRERRVIDGCVGRERKRPRGHHRRDRCAEVDAVEHDTVEQILEREDSIRSAVRRGDHDGADPGLPHLLQRLANRRFAGARHRRAAHDRAQRTCHRLLLGAYLRELRVHPRACLLQHCGDACDAMPLECRREPQQVGERRPVQFETSRRLDRAVEPGHGGMRKQRSDREAISGSEYRVRLLDQIVEPRLLALDLAALDDMQVLRVGTPAQDRRASLMGGRDDVQRQIVERRCVHAVEWRIAPQRLDLGPANGFGGSEHS